MNRGFDFKILALSLLMGIMLIYQSNLNIKGPGKSITIPTPTSFPLNGKPIQMVIVSFDGSRSLPMWEKTLNFASESRKKGIDIKFTYFISGVYLVPYTTRGIYQAPSQKTGESKIGFADNAEDVANRVKEINRAIEDGHEIASHLNGHFPGGKWSQSDWEKEFNSFNRFIGGASGLNIRSEEITGLRAPNLEVNPNLWPVLVNYKYRYEAGTMGKADSWPVKKDGVWRFILPAINLTGTKIYPLAMDYNFFVSQTGGRDILKKGTPEWNKALTQTTTSLKNYFQYNFTRNRAPVVFAGHFSEWNGGLYWEAMKIFAGEVCGLPEVKCTTYKELADYLDKYPKLTVLSR